MFVINGIQAQCKIASVKKGSYSLEIYDEGGLTMTIPWDKKAAYDYSSCWLGIAEWSSGYSIVFLYDGTRKTSQKSISFTGGRIKSLKIIGNKMRVVYEDRSEETKDIN